jgi:uncharacterized protein (TIGR03083 family)
LEVEGERLGKVAGGARLDAAVPGCPGWDVEALVRHIGDVHRWAETILRERLTQRLRRDFAGPPDRDGLLLWYREGHTQLLTTLAATSAQDVFWTWGEAPSALAFWARRQAHETGIHRLDAEQAAKVDETPFPAGVAADGIDEWLGLASHRTVVPGGRGRSLYVAPTDAPDRWLVTLRDDGITVSRGAAAVADCTLRAPANNLFALVMNRCGMDGVAVDGDHDVVRCWREFVRF